MAFDAPPPPPLDLVPLPRRDWCALARAVSCSRALREWNQTDLAQVAGVSLRTIQRVESGTEHGCHLPRSMPRIERALRWTPGAAAQILDHVEGSVVTMS